MTTSLIVLAVIFLVWALWAFWPRTDEEMASIERQRTARRTLASSQGGDPDAGESPNVRIVTDPPSPKKPKEGL